jgi:hypothetical protein
MSRRRLLLLAGLMMMAAVLAYWLRDVMHARLVVPLAYLYWELTVVYAFIPGRMIWIALLIVVLTAMLASFIPRGRRAQPRASRLKPAPGPIESLAALLVKARRGIYFKWRIANRLSRLLRQISAGPETAGITRSGNAALDRYLDAGLNGTFMDYPPPAGRWARAAPTPLDLDPQIAIDHLESQMEQTRGRHA